MKKLVINIKRSSSSYPIYVGGGILSQINTICELEKYTKVVIITDKVVEKVLLKNKPQYFPEKATFIVIPSGERAKNIDGVQEIWEELFTIGCDRKSVVVNIGGGVVTDIGGFAASTYMRGIPFINVPTTLLAQVDASVGGKTGINFLETKNVIGTFTQPQAIMIDTEVLKTLPEREFISGFGEIIKHGLVSDKNYFKKVTSKKPLEFSQNELVDFILTSCKIKATFVESDEKEGSLRKIVNFGHTIGHAIESISLETEFPLLHGEAVSIGMLAESYISEALGLLTKSEVATIKNSLLHAGLPSTYKRLDVNTVLQKIRADKKTEMGVANFTLLNGIGRAIVNQKVNQALIIDAIKKINEL